MAYSVAEQETVITYDNESREFDIYTTVPKHIRRLLKITSKTHAIFKLKQCELDINSNCTALRIVLPKLPPASTFNS